MNFETLKETRADLKATLANKNWGKQRVCYHSLRDWDNLDKDIRNALDNY